MKPTLVICDIDGTAADITHRRHFVENKPKRWDKFYDAMTEDVPNEWCKELIMLLGDAGHEIAFVTGRPENYKEQTVAWLKEHFWFDQPWLTTSLYMRPADNTEPDYVIKQRIYDENLKDRDVLFVIDDRKQVVDMWRSNGLTVLQCDEGNF